VVPGDNRANARTNCLDLCDAMRLHDESGHGESTDTTMAVSAASVDELPGIALWFCHSHECVVHRPGGHA